MLVSHWFSEVRQKRIWCHVKLIFAASKRVNTVSNLRQRCEKTGPQCVHAWLTRQPERLSAFVVKYINKFDRAIMWLHTLC